MGPYDDDDDDADYRNERGFPWGGLFFLLLAIAVLIALVYTGNQDRQLRIKMAEQGYCQDAWGKWNPCEEGK